METNNSRTGEPATEVPGTGQRKPASNAGLTDEGNTGLMPRAPDKETKAGLKTREQNEEKGGRGFRLKRKGIRKKEPKKELKRKSLAMPSLYKPTLIPP